VLVGGIGLEVIFQKEYWIIHANIFLTQPLLFIFCDDVLWGEIDHQISGMEI
jgi:hypothetical protein